ncbi:hypothetical protein ABZ543_17170 [Streptomyces roseifaciens]
MRRRRPAFALLAAAAATVVAAPTASAAPGVPAFLAPAELPPRAGTAWHGGAVTSGVPDPLPFCVGEALPGATSRHRAFWTDLDTSAVQVSVVERDASRAKALAGLLGKAVKDCAGKVEQEDPGTRATWRDLGRVQVADGAHVQGVQTTHTETGSDVHLFSVGRDGRTVTVVHWGQMGTFKDAPVSGFRNTTRTAVNKLY